MKTSVVIADPNFLGNTAPLKGSYDIVMRAAAEIGFDAVQLTVNRPDEISPKQVFDTAQKFNLAISSIATGLAYSVDGLSLGSESEENRKAATVRMKQHIDLAQKIGNPRVIIGAIRGHAKNCSSREKYEKQFRKSVEELITYADPRQIDIIFEANDHLETDAYLTIKETAEFIKEYNSPHFLLQLDTMHMLYENQHPYQDVIPYADLIAQIDISDENRMAPDGKHFDFPLLMKTLQEINYKDYLVFEYRPHPPQNAAKMGFDYIKALMQNK